MGFRSGAYATIWEAKPVSNKSTSLRLSTSRKNKMTGNYETDFSGFCLVVGQDLASQASQLTRGDRIKLGDCEVTTKYDAVKKVQYTNFTVFGFEKVESRRGNVATSAASHADPTPASVYEGETPEESLPF